MKWAMDSRPAPSSARRADTPGPGGKVRIGFFSFTEVTDPSAHRSYNHWHQLDHLPEQLPLPGVAWGQRWVSTPACRRARAVEGPLLAPIHYMTLYLMTDPLEQTLEDFAALGAELHQAGRFHQQRRSHLSGPFEVVSARSAERVLVSAAALPYRPNKGVYVLVEETGSAAPLEIRQPTVDEALSEVEGVAGAWAFVASPLAGERWHPGPRRITVCFLDGDPLRAASAMKALVSGVAGRSMGEVIFAGPFETIVPWQWDWFEDNPL
jgi:hypothetical protein